MPEARRNEISRFILDKRRAGIAELADALSVSEETIRRDLNVLHERGVVMKVHGGAVSPDRPGMGTLERRRTVNVEEKHRITLAAAPLFLPGQSLMLDGGTTTEMLATVLASRGPFTVITNSMDIARSFWHGSTENTVVMLGGELRLDTDETLGEITLSQLKNFNADHAIIGVAGVSQAGQMMRYRIDEQMVAKAMAMQAKNVTVLADHTKFSIDAPLNICELLDVTNLVTDEQPPEKFIALAKEAATHIRIAKPAADNDRLQANANSYHMNHLRT